MLKVENSYIEDYYGEQIIFFSLGSVTFVYMPSFDWDLLYYELSPEYKVTYGKRTD